MPRLITAELNMTMWVDIVARLRADFGWEPVYWAAVSGMRAPVTAAFPGIVFHDSGQGRLGLPAPGLNHLLDRPADDSTLAALAEYRTTALKIMDRITEPGGFPDHEREALFRKMVGYWSAVVDRFQPDVALFPTAPHMVYDYILYAICRHRGVKTFMFERSPLPGRIFLQTDFRDGPLAAIEHYRQSLVGSTGEVVLPPEIEAYLAKLAGNYQKGLPSHLEYKLTQEKKRTQPAAKPTVLSRLRRAAGNVSSVVRGRQVPVYIKRRGRPVEETQCSAYGRWRQQRKCLAIRRRLVELYDSLAGPVDVEAPFIYVALQCQPERATCILGGEFIFQERMVQLLADVLPPGWKLYVKEHISQFRDYQRAEQGKTEQFYRSLAALPTVSLVPLSLNSFELIDRAKAVATVTSTAGWEAVNRGVPALIFGQAPYKGCEGVYYSPDERSCREAMELVASGRGVDKRLVKLYAKAQLETSQPGYIDPVYAETSNITPEDNISTIIELLKASVT